MADFIGEYCNKDFDTRGITRAHIRCVDNKLRIHMWGRCHPIECDWGEETATITENGQLLTVNWHQSFAIRTQKLRLLTDDTLELSCHSHYIDNSGRRDRDDIDYLERGLVHDWSEEAAES